MDGSPLILAQSHARKASKADTPTLAIEEHEHAAGQFAAAAKGTENSEAFRTLKLLEQHHAKLSKLLKSRTSVPASVKTETLSEKTPSPVSPAPSASPTQARSPFRPETQSFAAAHRPQRDVGSSIASNLASARGIPSNKQRRSAQASSPALAQQQAEGKIVSPQRRSKLAETASKPAKDASGVSEKSGLPIEATPSTSSRGTASKPGSTSADSTTTAKSDEGFNRFYNTFESLFSKLSAPLAFAGLPLNPDSENNSSDPAPTPPSSTTQRASQAKRPSKSSSRATAEPDYSGLFSPAALAAVREEPGGANLGAAESFYVVPTTSGATYASILARHQSQHPKLQQNQHQQHHHNRHLSRDSTGLSEDLDEFVDARETPGPPSPLASRGAENSGGKRGGKSMEELQLENESLRGVLDEMSRRLWQFEMGAQMGSVALQQSIRASLNRNHPSGGGGGGGSPPTTTSEATEKKGGPLALEGRLAGLEDEVTRARKELDRMGRENEKLKGVVGRYRERWEKLKEGARTRRGTSTGTGPSTSHESGLGGLGGGAAEEAVT